MTTRAFFSSSRDALRFALNHEDTSIPGPVMNKEMAATPAASGGGILSPSGKPTPASKAVNFSHVALGGTSDRTMMAGWILQRFNQVGELRRTLLMALIINPRRICSCGSDCCRGWAVRKSWYAAVIWLFEYLKTEAELTKEPGKRGLSTDPRLRTLLIEDYCKPEAKRASLADLARISETSPTTVAKHRELIHSFLGAVELEAWEEVGQLFDACGITGEISES